MNVQTNECPICGAPNLAAEKYTAQLKHGGAELIVEDMERSHCASCGAQPVMTDQIKRNQIKIADGKRAHDRLLSSRDICTIRSVLGLSQADAALVFGGGGNAFSKYERGEVIQSAPMDKLLRLAWDCPMLVHQLALYAGVSLRTEPIVDQAYMEAPPHVTAAIQERFNICRDDLVPVYSNDYRVASG